MVALGPQMHATGRAQFISLGMVAIGGAVLIYPGADVGDVQDGGMDSVSWHDQNKHRLLLAAHLQHSQMQRLRDFGLAEWPQKAGQSMTMARDYPTIDLRKWWNQLSGLRLHGTGIMTL